MSEPYMRDCRWYVQLSDGREVEFESDTDAWAYIEAHEEPEQ